MREIRSQKETINALAHLIRQVKHAYSNEQPLVVGIHTGGAWIASRICNQLHWDEPATLDISLYRDDFETSGLKRSGITDRMPKQLNGERILLVDDVLFTGRTIRAAINVLFDYGRPSVLIWRSYSIVVAANYLSNQIFLENLLVKTGSDGVNSLGPSL